MKFLPERRLISSFGNGGFRFGDHSHLGHLLVLPSGMRAWNGEDLAQLVAEKDHCDFFLFGTGSRIMAPPMAFRQTLAAERISFDVMSTSVAVHTYNIMLAEDRRVAAGFLAVP